MTTIAASQDQTNFWVGSGGIATSESAKHLRNILFEQTIPALRQADTWNRLGNTHWRNEA